MSKRIFRKKIVVGIVIVFFAIGLLPNLYAKTNFNNQKKSTVTLYAFGENFFKENKIDISTEDAKIIFNNFNELKKVIINDPHSDKAQVLRNNFVNILEEKSMLPKGVSKDEFIKLLSPSDVINPQLKNVFCRLFNFKNIIRYPIFNKAIQLLKNKFKDINPPVESFDASATLNFCTLVSYGDGYTIPVMIPARPRIGITWSANFSETYAGEVFSNKGFYAKGSQSGSTIGFTGGGGTFAFPGFKFYVFVGYTWHVKVSADHIDFYPPNQPPVISDENPINGAIDVPITLSELSFRIGDPEGEKMDYTVTASYVGYPQYYDTEVEDGWLLTPTGEDWQHNFEVYGSLNPQQNQTSISIQGPL